MRFMSMKKMISKYYSKLYEIRMPESQQKSKARLSLGKNGKKAGTSLTNTPPLQGIWLHAIGYEEEGPNPLRTLWDRGITAEDQQILRRDL